MFVESPAVLSAPTAAGKDPQANGSPGTAGTHPAAERGVHKMHCPKNPEAHAEQKVEVELMRI